MNNCGLTLMELMVVIVLFAILMGSVGYVFTTGTQLWTKGYDRADIRGRMSQAMEKIIRQVRLATSIDAISSSSITFSADLGSGTSSYTVYLYNALDSEPNPPYTQTTYQLRWRKGAGSYGTGAILAENILKPTEAVFSQSSNTIAIDLTGSRSGQVMRLRSKVRPRNL